MPLKAAPKLDTLDWSGFYLGGHVGYAWGRSDWTAVPTGTNGQPVAGSLNFYQPFNVWDGEGSYFAGLQGGYNVMLPSRFVVGVEADVMAPNLVSGDQRIATATIGSALYEERMFISATARGRLGYGFGNWLPYMTGGLAWTYDRATWNQVTGAPAGSAAGAGLIEQHWLGRFGWTIGAGIEFPFAPNWTARVEYLFTDFGNHAATFPAAAQRTEANLTISQLRLGLNYRLPADRAGGDRITDQTLSPNLENIAIHAQTTFIGQYAFPFRSPYQGANSLTPNAGREGWDVTLYAGLRPWQGAEIWINPEIDQGFALSDFRGVAAFVNNDPSKGASYPFARIQRAFFEQTINLGGKSRRSRPTSINLQRREPPNRLVITAGKFAVGDVFDLNRYAQDARTDFMNLGVVSTGTFDYAADTFGYTYGATAEWYLGPLGPAGGLFRSFTRPGRRRIGSGVSPIPVGW